MKHPVLLNPALIFAGALLMGMTGLPCAALAQTMETDEQLFMQNVTAPPPEPVEEVSPAEVPEEFQMENDGVQLVSVSDAPVSESPQEPPPPSPNPEIVVVSEPPPEDRQMNSWLASRWQNSLSSSQAVPPSYGFMSTSSQLKKHIF